MPVVMSTPTPSATVNMKSSAPSSSTVFFIKPEFAAFYIPFISGAVSGIAAACVGQPFDTIKVRMQTGFKMPCGAISMGAVQTLKSTRPFPKSPGSIYRIPGVGATGCSYLTALRLQMRHEGVLGLFSGLGPQLASQIVATALLFGAQDSILHSLARRTGRGTDDLGLICASGSVSGGLLSLLTCPMELVKCGMQSSRSGAAMLAVRGRAPNSVEMATSIVRNVISSKGVSGLYTGLTLTCLRCSIGNAAFFGVHESCWRIDRRVDPCGSSSAWKCMFYGAIAGSAYWLVSYPMDLMKSRRQCDAVQGQSSIPLPWRHTQNARAVGLTVATRLTRMYKGLGITLIRGIPVASVGWLVFGFCKSTLEN